MLEGGPDLRIIQQMLGHASAETTAIYTSVDIALLREVYAKTHPSADPDNQLDVTGGSF